MAKKTKEPAKAGDVTTVIGGVKALINHLSSEAWNEALGDLYAIGKELYLGFAAPQLSMAKLEVGAECCSPENVKKLCEELDSCCDKIEGCDGDEKKLTKITFSDSEEVPKTPQAIGPLVSLFAPLLLQALQAIINGLLKKEAKSA